MGVKSRKDVNRQEVPIFEGNSSSGEAVEILKDFKITDIKLINKSYGNYGMNHVMLFQYSISLLYFYTKNFSR